MEITCEAIMGNGYYRIAEMNEVMNEVEPQRVAGGGWRAAGRSPVGIVHCEGGHGVSICPEHWMDFQRPMQTNSFRQSGHGCARTQCMVRPCRWL